MSGSLIMSRLPVRLIFYSERCSVAALLNIENAEETELAFG
jgi:hypothetical protein